MGTKYRKDLTPEDFRIVSRFKHHLHRLSINERINLQEWTAPTVHEQNWYLSGMGWKDNGKKARKDQPCYFLSMRDFRTVVRGVSQDIDTVTEGLVIETLKRFSMILFTKEGKWKWQGKDGTPVIVLERQRLSPEGTIKKRNPETAKAKLNEYVRQINETANTQGISFEAALQFHSAWGITAELIQDLARQIDEAADKKEEIRAEIDERIRQRTKR
jgi:hypothetical protein